MDMKMTIYELRGEPGTDFSHMALRKNQTLPTMRFWTLAPDGESFCGLSCPALGLLLWQPQQTDTTLWACPGFAALGRHLPPWKMSTFSFFIQQVGSILRRRKSSQCPPSAGDGLCLPPSLQAPTKLRV